MSSACRESSNLPGRDSEDSFWFQTDAEDSFWFQEVGGQGEVLENGNSLSSALAGMLMDNKALPRLLGTLLLLTLALTLAMAFRYTQPSSIGRIFLP